MSPQRPSKQKRAAQNRSQRAARAERVLNANAAPSATPVRGPSASRSAGSSGGSLLSRLRGGGAGRGASSTATPRQSARARGAALRADQPPGYRAAMSALLAAAAAVMLCTVALRYPVDARGDVYTAETLAADWSISAARAVAAHPDDTAKEVAASVDSWAPDRSKETVAKALWPFSLSILLPLAGAGLGFQAVRKRSSAKTVNRALYATLLGAVLTQGLLMLFLPVVLAMGVAMYQVRKAEAIAAASGASDVIEVDEVEEVAAGDGAADS
ncbi:MAG: hypothetical protein ACT4OV_00275 [Microthrixaceae bacterium]